MQILRLTAMALVLCVAATLSYGEDEGKNELSAIVAGTHEDGTTFFTLGVEYERDLSEPFAVSVIGEAVLEGESREGLVVVPLVLKPWRGLKLLAGPGFERSKDDGTSFLFRWGVGWGFELGERFSLVPTVELDLVNGSDGVEEVLVFGASVGFSF